MQIVAKHWLASLSGSLGLVALGSVLFVLVVSLNPSERAKAVHGNTTVDISSLTEDGIIRVKFPRKNGAWTDVAIYRPSSESTKELISLNGIATGTNITAVTAPTIYVYRPYSTHLGCPLERLSTYPSRGKVPSGWWDPCHVGAWDMAGRTLEMINGTGYQLPNLERVEFKWVSERVIELIR